MNFCRPENNFTNSHRKRFSPGIRIFSGWTSGITCLLLVFFMASCSEFFPRVEKDDEWVVHEYANIILYSRPENHSQTASPDDDAIFTILENQHFYYETIKDSLGLNFQEKVMIYLYNLDEAINSIGTYEGGHAVADRSSIYYTFKRPSFRDNFDRIAYIGPFEMVQVITQQAFGKPFTQMMNVGYAMAFTGTMGRDEGFDGEIYGHRILFLMEELYRNDQLMTPHELLHNTGRARHVYYPNAGFFVLYLWKHFGITNINRLFSLSREEFEKGLLQVTGNNLDDLTDHYLSYCHDRLSD